MVERVAETRFTSRSGANWTAQVFRDKASGEEQLALVHGGIDPGKPTLVRMHSIDLFADVLGEQSQRAGLLDGAMAMIEAEGAGVIVALHAAAPGSLSLATDLRSGKAPEGGGTGAARLWHRRADPRRARHPRHDPAVQHPPCAGRAFGLWAGDRRGALHHRFGELTWPMS